MKSDKALSEVLGINYEEHGFLPPVKNTKKEVPVKKEVVKKQEIAKLEKRTTEIDPLGADAIEDYARARDTFINLIDKGNNAIEELLELAKVTEEARKFEVLAHLIKTVSETTKDLYDLQKKTKDLMDLKSPDKKVDSGHITVEKAVFVGTSADLLKQAKGIKE